MRVAEHARVRQLPGDGLEAGAGAHREFERNLRKARRLRGEVPEPAGDGRRREQQGREQAPNRAHRLRR